MTKPLDPSKIDQLIADYLAGQLAADDRAAFEAWLRASPDNPRHVARLGATDYAIREVCQDTKADYLLDALRQIDQASGPAELVTLHHLTPSPWHRYRLFAIGGAIAAVLVLAVTLTFVLSGNRETESIATNPIDSSASRDPGRDGPDHNQASPASVVATLTAERDAVWAEGASAPGSSLRAGQRLSLTQGFAEITTHRGAIAIIEAPATVELTDSDNAIRLHAGKLFGICETPSSKGFVVRTPHMDVIDLGTRFGVSVTDKVFTATVITGEVVLSRQDRPQQLLVANQTASLDLARFGREFVIEDSLTMRFAEHLPGKSAVNTLADRDGELLAGTGRAHADGEADRNWRVIAVDGQPVTEYGELVVSQKHHDGDSDPNNSQWLVINKALNPPNKAQVVYTCAATVDVPATVDPEASQLVVRCEADFSVKAIRVNGQSLKVPANRIGNGWLTIPVDQTFATGPNTIEVDVQEYLSNRGKPNSSSLRVEVILSPRIPIHIPKGGP